MHWTAGQTRCVIGLLLSYSIAGLSPTAATSTEDATIGSLPKTRPEISGLILDQHGEPVADAQLEIVSLPDSFTTSLGFLTGVSPEVVANGRCDGSGRFRLRAPRPGLYRLVARAEGYVTMQQRPVVLLANRELAPVRLLPDVGLDLRLTAAAGQPAVDACVVAKASSDSRFMTRMWAPLVSRGWRPQPRFTRIDASGYGRLSRALNEPLDLHLPATPIELAVTSPRDLVLAATEPRRLRVTDAAGRPLAGVVVQPGSRPWPAGTTDANGDFALAAPVGEPLEVLLLAADGRLRRQLIEPTLATTITVPDLRSVTGLVVDADSGEPLVGAWIWPAGDPGRHVRIDAHGRYRLRLPPDRQTLQAEVSGYVPQMVELVAGNELASPQETTLQRFALHRAVRLSGRVSDPDGRALADVHLEALAEPDHERTFLQVDRIDQRALSRSDGRYTIDRLEAGVTYLLRASAPGFAPKRQIFTAPRSSSARSRLDLVLRPRVDVYGQVVDLADRALAGAQLELRRSGSALDSGLRAESAADGSFELLGIPAATFDLKAQRAGFAATVVRGVGVPSEERRFDLGVIVLGPGAVIEGRVIDTNGDGVAGARIHSVPSTGPRPRPETLAAVEPAAVSAADGRFTISDLTPGDRVDLRVAGAGYTETWSRRIRAPGSEPLVIELEAAVVVRGRVVAGAATEPGGDTWKGIPGARIDLESRDILAGSGGRLRAGRSVSRHGLTDESGHFELAGVPAGDAVLRVEAEGYITLESVSLSVPTADAGGVELVLEVGATLEGFVTAADEPVPETRVSADAVSVLSDREGFYRLAGVRPGQVEVEVVHPDYLPVSRTLTLDDGVERLDLQVPEGRSVSGQVVDEGRWPVAGAAVRFSGHHHGRRLDYRADTAADGSFHFATVARSHYQVVVSREGYAVAERERPLVVADAPIDDLTLVLSRGVTVSGRVLGLSFDEVSRVRVDAAEQAGRSVAGLVDYAGGFRLEGLGVGDWIVGANLDGGRRQAKRRLAVTLQSGDQELDLELGGELILTGRVLHAGEPLPDTRVSLSGLDVDDERAVLTDHVGAFRIDDLRRGSYRLGLANAAEYLVHNQILRLEGDRHLDLDLRGANVSGRVSAAGQPVAGALVVLERQVDSDHAASFIVTGDTDTDGEFHLPRIPSGAFQLTVRRDAYAQAEQALEVPAGGDVSGLLIELEPTPGLVLDVRLASGAIPPGVHLQVASVEGRPFLSETRTPDATGRVRFPTVPAGRWQLALGAPGAASVKVSAAVPGDPIALVLQPAGRLDVRVPALADSDLTAAVRVQDSAGGPLEVIELGGRQRQSWQLRGGKAEVDGVPAGLWSVVVTDPLGGHWDSTFTTSGAGVMSVVLE